MAARELAMDAFSLNKAKYFDYYLLSILVLRVSACRFRLALLLGRFDASGFAICARILGHFTPLRFKLPINVAFLDALLPLALRFALAISVALLPHALL